MFKLVESNLNGRSLKWYEYKNYCIVPNKSSTNFIIAFLGNKKSEDRFLGEADSLETAESFFDMLTCEDGDGELLEY